MRVRPEPLIPTSVTSRQASELRAAVTAQEAARTPASNPYDWLVRIVVEIVHKADRDRLLGLAAETAFFAVLTLFPALLVATSVLGQLQLLIGQDNAVRVEQSVLDFLDTVLTDTASPAVDLVFAEHAHVVQPITRVNGKWVVYGMGNMVGQSDTAYPRAYEGISVRFTFRDTGHGFHVTRASYIPTWWNHYSPGHPIRVRPVLSALRHGVGDRARLLEARRMTRLAVDGLAPPGDTTPGLRQR